MKKIYLLIISIIIIFFIIIINIKLNTDCLYNGEYMNEIRIRNTLIQYDDLNVRILDSHLINNELLMRITLQDFKFRTGYCSKRSVDSWVKEWKAHNRLYNIGLYKNHTKDCDLEECEIWWKLLIYEIIGI